jgi:hypothetical protein
MANRQLKLKVSQAFKPPTASLQRTLRNWSRPRQNPGDGPDMSTFIDYH